MCTYLRICITLITPIHNFSKKYVTSLGPKSSTAFPNSTPAVFQCRKHSPLENRFFPYNKNFFSNHPILLEKGIFPLPVTLTRSFAAVHPHQEMALRLMVDATTLTDCARQQHCDTTSSKVDRELHAGQRRTIQDTTGMMTVRRYPTPKTLLGMSWRRKHERLVLFYAISDRSFSSA